MKAAKLVEGNQISMSCISLCLQRREKSTVLNRNPEAQEGISTYHINRWDVPVGDRSHPSMIVR